MSSQVAPGPIRLHMPLPRPPGVCDARTRVRSIRQASLPLISGSYQPSFSTSPAMQLCLYSALTPPSPSPLRPLSKERKRHRHRLVEGSLGVSGLCRASSAAPGALQEGGVQRRSEKYAQTSETFARSLSSSAAASTH